MSSIRFKTRNKDLSVGDIRVLREVCALPIGEIKRRAANHEPVIEIEVFKGDWESNRKQLARLVHAIAAGKLPLEIYDYATPSGFPATEELLSAPKARDMIRSLRQIELDTQMDIDLEEGEISSPSEFESPEDDWTEPIVGSDGVNPPPQR
jgi:hypothetical protein